MPAIQMLGPGTSEPFSFRLMDRERYALQLENPSGKLIGSNMAALDLFSFDVPGGGRVRSNLEALFQKYEADIEVHTRNLRVKLRSGESDIKAEIIDLFAAKLVSIVPIVAGSPSSVEVLAFANAG